MEANEVVFKTTKIKSHNHFITHSKYLKKDNAKIFSEPSEKNMLEVINLDIKRGNNKKGKRGRPAQVAKGLVFSIPKDMEEYVLNLSFKEQEQLINGFLDTLFRDIKKEHKNADIGFLKKNTLSVLHNDTEHLHFQCLVPNFTKSSNWLSKELIAIHWSNLKIVGNAKRKMFNSLNALKGIKKEMTMEEFREKSKSKKSYEERDNSWKQRRDKTREQEKKLKDKAKQVDMTLEELKEEQSKLRTQREHSIKLAKELQGDTKIKVDKYLATAAKQIENGTTKKAESTLAKATKLTKSTLAKATTTI